MTFLPSGPLLSVPAIVGPALLGVGLSAGAFAGIAAYALRRASLETGESPFVLVARARTRLLSTVERARARWQSGEVRRSWSRQRRTGLRLVLGVLAGQAALVLGMATSSQSLLGPGTAAFAVTVVVVSCLLANAVLILLWLAGPKPEGEGRFYAPDSGHAAAEHLRTLFGQGRRALPGKSE